MEPTYAVCSARQRDIPHGTPPGRDVLYFLTVCTRHMRRTLGEVTAGTVTASRCGTIAEACFREVIEKCPGAALDRFLLMPNHLHAIVRLSHRGETPPLASGETAEGQMVRRMIHSFKLISSRRIRSEQIAKAGRFWQPHFYSYQIQNEEEHSMLRKYLQDAMQWWDGNWDDLSP